MNNVGNTKELRIISLCTGYGGLDEGIRLAEHPRRVREVVAVEIKAFNVANLVAKMESGHMDACPIWTDIKTFPSELFYGKVHGITAGYPCQPFSDAGQRKGTDDPRHLWQYIREIVSTVRPVWCFFENVSGHLTLGFDEVYRSLRDLGYRVEAGLFTATEVGAPHKRERLFILAYSDSIGNRTGFSKGSKANGEISKRNKDAEFEQSSENVGHTKHQGLEGKTIAEESEITAEGCGKLADTSCQGLQGHTEYKIDNQKRWQGQDGYSSQKDTSSRWPSRPGQSQYEWEHPRTATKEEVKSALGLSVDGYDYRTDFLHSLGNGVVPQTAARAWIELWKKMDKVSQ